MLTYQLIQVSSFFRVPILWVGKFERYLDGQGVDSSLLLKQKVSLLRNSKEGSYPLIKKYAKVENELLCL